METKPEIVEEYLGLGNLVDRMPKKNGGKPFLVPRLFIEKISNKWRKMKTNLEIYAGKDEVNKKIEEKEEKVEEKINDWEDYRKEARGELRNIISDKENCNQKEFDNVSAAMSYAKEKIEKLKQKKIKVNKKGLGIFALSTIAIKKLASDKFHKIKVGIENRLISPIKDEINARRRAKEEDKVIREYNKKPRVEKTQLKNEDLSEIMKQILEELKRLNSNIQALNYQQDLGETPLHTK